MGSLKIIETERLYLRALKMDDHHELSKVLSDPESMQYYPHPFNQEEVKNWISWNEKNYKQYNHGLWAVVLKEGDRFIGDCGITMQNIDGLWLPEIGFHIIKAYWNKGYATEAAFACKEYAFNVLGYSEIFSYTTLKNIPSQKVAEKIGMENYKFFEKNGEQQIVQVAYKSL
ncbi:GNAT family N-acetyltransferase [Lysinibacillus boronitolerans]|nr:GNAT family N-acetyltransferase [Lysinibacillus boronitolerans]